MFISRKRGFMTFSGKIKVSIALLMAVGSCAMAAKSTSGKVIDKLGDAKLQKAANVGTWTEISFGNRVKEKDQIRTGIESHVAIALSDGSSISIEENSLVEFTTLEAENGIQTALTDVKTGKVKFDAQKQHSGGTSSSRQQPPRLPSAVRTATSVGRPSGPPTFSLSVTVAARSATSTATNAT